MSMIHLMPGGEPLSIYAVFLSDNYCRLAAASKPRSHLSRPFLPIHGLDPYQCFTKYLMDCVTVGACIAATVLLDQPHSTIVDSSHMYTLPSSFSR